jgi:hypothetical protein
MRPGIWNDLEPKMAPEATVMPLARLIGSLAWAGVSVACVVLAEGSPEMALAHAARCLDGQSASLATSVPASLHIVTLAGHCGWCWAALGAAMLGVVNLLIPVGRPVEVSS